MTTAPSTEVTTRPRKPTVRVPLQAIVQDVCRQSPDLVTPFDVEAIRETVKARGLPDSSRDEALDFWIEWHRRDLDPSFERKPSKAASRAQRATGDAEFAAYLDALWSHYRRMTGSQARADVGATATVFSIVKPRQLVEDAMTREQFAERWAAAKT